MYSGQTAIDYLGTEVSKDDSGESSHWRKYHSAFRFTGGGFEGLQGFGGSEKPYRGLRFGLHRLLQRRFRRMGAEFPQFTVIDGLANEITTRQRRAYDLDVLRQALTLAFLKNHVPNALFPRATACVIGDGFASMTTLLLASGSASRIVLINLTKTLLVDIWYLKLWMGAEAFESSVDLVTDGDSLAHALAKSATNEAGEGGRVVAIQASDRKLLRNCPVDVALNIASMQEMNPPVIAAYFDDMRAIASQRQLVFYCCNREEKTLPDGTVTRFAAYPWHEGDQILVDELCPWHQQYYALRPPFYRPYDGPIRHRLLTLA
ncbi:MAG: sugar O-methyltransferase [Pseudomonadota bacterium]